MAKNAEETALGRYPYLRSTGGLPAAVTACGLLALGKAAAGVALLRLGGSAVERARLAVEATGAGRVVRITNGHLLILVRAILF